MSALEHHQEENLDQDSIFTAAYIAAFSPRSKEACVRQGIEPEDLMYQYVYISAG
jgi:hypothetical protein